MARELALLRLPFPPPRRLILRNANFGRLRVSKRLCLRRRPLALFSVSVSSLATRTPDAVSVPSAAEVDAGVEAQSGVVGVGTVGSPPLLVGQLPMGLSDRAFFLLALVAFMTSAAFTSLTVAAIPTLFAMRRAAISLAKLADTAREELPSTMAAIRLSGMEISDLTLELSDLSQEIAGGFNKSTQAVQAAEAGIRKIGAMAKQQTLAIIEERANLPDISLKPVVTGAARKTSNVVGQAKRSIINLFAGGANCDGTEHLYDRPEA